MQKTLQILLVRMLAAAKISVGKELHLNFSTKILEAAANFLFSHQCHLLYKRDNKEIPTSTRH